MSVCPLPEHETRLLHLAHVQGDSGGPLFIKGATWDKDVVVGATSFGQKCGNAPGVYTSIPKMRPWIDSTIKNLNTTFYEYAIRITTAGGWRAVCWRAA